MDPLKNSRDAREIDTQLESEPTALIRAQHQLELPWIRQKIRRHIGYHAEILDLGCGLGFLPNDLAKVGYRVSAIDLSAECLQRATAADETKSVKYQMGDVYRTPFANQSFDVVTAMDLLEHVSDRQRLLDEAARVLRPGGLFIYNTLNHHPLAWIVNVKGIELFVRNVPRDYHVYSLFIRPNTLIDWLNEAGFESIQMCGVRPVFLQNPLRELLIRGRVLPQFRYRFSRSLSIGYIGCAKKMRAQ